MSPDRLDARGHTEDALREDEIREAKELAAEVNRICKHDWTIMEVCGGQTHAIMKYGIDQMLPKSLRIVHGPGCPVCVTSVEILDQAIAIAQRARVVLCTYGDMLRVPGTKLDLARARGLGATLRVIHSPLDACRIASEELRSESPREVVLFAIGFETTAPATAMAVRRAAAESLHNFSVLVSHVLVPPGLDAIFQDPDHGIDGVLAAGHVCAITGYEAYEEFAERYRTPVVVTGFSPIDLLRGMVTAVRELEAMAEKPQVGGRVLNAYPQVVQRIGNRAARNALDDVFEPCDQIWRGLGVLPGSGYKLRGKYRLFDAMERFKEMDPCRPNQQLPQRSASTNVSTGGSGVSCRAAEVLRGKIRPTQCEAFGKECTPTYPLGAPMVSNEGACAAYFHHARHGKVDDRVGGEA
jgi:hydrogenase expression/formation protein HypD